MSGLPFFQTKTILYCFLTVSPQSYGAWSSGADGNEERGGGGGGEGDGGVRQKNLSIILPS